MKSRHCQIMAALIMLIALPAAGKSKKLQGERLDDYVQRMTQEAPDLTPTTVGSLWTDNGRLAFLTGDYKASRLGDLITVVVLHDVTASNANSVATNRSFSASSGISALAGHLSTSGVQNIFSPTSAEALAGKSQASTTSKLQTRLAGRVVAVLPSGLLVIEAERLMTMNNEKQTLVLRGLVRSGDIAPGNTVSSDNIGNLELELKGKGVLSDGTRPPNFLLRALMRIVNF